VLPETDDPERFLALGELFLGAQPESARPCSVGSVRFHQTKRGTEVLLTLEGVSTREAADAFKHLWVYAREEDLPPLGDDEVFLSDLIGLSVETIDGEQVGQVKDLFEGTAQDLFLISRPDNKDILIPAVPAFIEMIDLESQRIVIRPIEGLLDD